MATTQIAPATAPATVSQSPRFETVLGPDDRFRVTGVEGHPWDSIGKITVSAPGGTFVGTGAMVSPFHILTAAHVLENPGFGGDGRALSAQIALGKSGNEEPYGRAEMVSYRVLPGWSDGYDLGQDMALITLDRSVGNTTGWFDFDVRTDVDFYDGVPVSLAGYPVDLSQGRDLYLATGAIAQGTEERFYYGERLDTAGGMSGAPIWQNLGAGNRKLIGVHSTGVADPDAPGALNGGTRLTEEKRILIEEWIGADEIDALPNDRADLADYDRHFESATATISKTLFSPGEEISIEASVYNLGTATATPVEVTVYLSTNPVISGFDTALGTVTL
ncbi:MAG: trypsin-like serine protease, partial [Pseudomonadota bacterium]